jgi:hypothetical protein
MGAESVAQRAWKRALELERAGDLAQAEEVVLESIDHLGAFGRVAYLYQLRMERLAREGDRDGAIAAFRRSDHWMWVMASGATSGGEGTALSYQATEHRKALVTLLGFDPGGE